MCGTLGGGPAAGAQALARTPVPLWPARTRACSTRPGARPMLRLPAAPRTGSHCTVRLGHSSACVTTKSAGQPATPVVRGASRASFNHEPREQHPASGMRQLCAALGRSRAAAAHHRGRECSFSCSGERGTNKFESQARCTACVRLLALQVYKLAAGSLQRFRSLRQQGRSRGGRWQAAASAAQGGRPLQRRAFTISCIPAAGGGAQ